MATCAPTGRAKRQSRRSRGHAPVARAAEPLPQVVAVFRRSDGTVCHARCGQPLTLQGVRGLLEADFYCYRCLAHVTIPLAVLDTLPPAPDGARGTALAAR